MFRFVRGSATPRHGVRYLLSLLSCFSIAGGVFAATRADAAPSDWLSVELLQVGTDSTGTVQVPRPATTLTPPAPTILAPPAPKPKANYLHLQGGLFVPIDVNAPSPTLGIRLGRRVTGHMRAGLLVDWTFERKNLEQPVNSLPGLQPFRVLARADGQLIPAMLFIEVNLTEKRFLVPFGGVAAGYEWLLLRANDYRTGEFAKATYANFAWQGWGGLGMRLDKGLRVDAELFYNGGSLERDVTDTLGQTWTEAVRVNGVGARVGVDISY